MRANEIMLGNWVYYSEFSRFAMQVTDIYETEICLDFEGNEGGIFDSLPDDLAPIPITEELLLKNGFSQTEAIKSLETNEDTYSLNLKNDAIIVLIGGKDGFEFTFSSSNGLYSTIPNITYVHQLQNCMNILGMKFDFKM